MRSNDIDQLVPVVGNAFIVRHYDAVTIAIQSNSNVSSVFSDGILDRNAMRCSTFMVYVQAVRLRSDGYNICTQFVEHVPSNLVCGTMRAINHDSEAAQIQMVGKGTFAKLNVAPARVADTARLAELCRGHRSDRCVEPCLYLLLNGIGKFGASGGKKFDAVIFERIVRSRDDNSGL